MRTFLFSIFFFFAGFAHAGTPDLIVTSIAQSPSNPLPGQAVTFSAVLKNVGNGAIRPAKTIGVTFAVDGQTVSWGYNTMTLKAGASVTLTAIGGPSSSIWSATSGTHQLRAYVDDVNRIVESSESNNTLVNTLIVGATPMPTPAPTATPAPTPISIPTSTEAGGITARNVMAFIDTLGVCVHMSWSGTPYANATTIANNMKYIGLHNFRDFADAFNAQRTLMANGNRANFINDNGNIPGLVSTYRSHESAFPGSIKSFEGPNEVNGWPINYGGQTGIAGANAYQRALYSAIKSDSLLSSKPVYVYSLSGLTLSLYQASGDLSGAADAGNVHIYWGGGQPAYGWSPGDSTWHWTSYGKMAQVSVPGKPVVVTEMGATTSTGQGGVSETTQAKTVLNSLLEGARNGNPATYIYELMESRANGVADYESHFGLYRWDGSAKPAAVALHNFTSVLTNGSTSAAYQPGPLKYTVSGLPNQWAGQLLFQQQNGVFDLVLWAQPDIWNESTMTPIGSPTYPITVNFENAHDVAIYDPLLGAPPVQSARAVKTITINVTDHPLILEVK